MVQTKNMKVLVKYQGTIDYNEQNKQVKFHYFIPVEKNKEIKWIKIREDNPIIPSLTLTVGNQYELNWIERDKKAKRVFRKHDNIVIISQTPEETIQGNQCASCQKDICQKGKSSANWYIISLNSQEVYGNKKWCADCLPAVRTLCESNIWGVNKDDIFGSNLERLHKSKGSIKTINGKDTLTVDVAHGSPWTCPWCEEKWNDNETKETVLNHYAQTHGKGKKDNQQENDEPQDNHDHDNQKIAEVGTVRKYCQTNEIKRLEYDEDTDKLIITYKSNKPSQELTVLNEELEKIKEYLKEKGKKDHHKRYLTNEDWEEDRQPSQYQAKETDYTPYWLAGGVGLFVIALIAVIGLVRRD